MSKGFLESLFDGLEEALDTAIDPLGLSEYYGGKDSPFNPFTLDPFTPGFNSTKEGDDKGGNSSGNGFWDW